MKIEENQVDIGVEFARQQDSVRKMYGKLKEFVDALKTEGFSISKDAEDKMKQICNGISENEKLKVLLIGGFSEGKTSIAAAWLGKEFDNMRISESESTDEVQVYEDEYISLVDTPGLFGFGVKKDICTGTYEEYKDITKKYVSNAHIVLYVMNASNPVKESHSDCLRWLFRELNLLSRTVFVVSRFDNVVKIADDAKYKAALDIMRMDVVKRLGKILSLTSDEEEKIRIVGVSANPYGQGLAYWRENPEKYAQLSRMDSLRKETESMIRNIGKISLLSSEKSTVCNDIILQALPDVEEKYEKMRVEVGEHEKDVCRKKDEVDASVENIRRVRSDLKSSIHEFFCNLCLEIAACDFDNLKLFMQNKIGKNGCVLHVEIEKMFNEKTQGMGVGLGAFSSFEFETCGDGVGQIVLNLASNLTEKAAGNVKARHVEIFVDDVKPDVNKLNLSLMDKAERKVGKLWYNDESYEPEDLKERAIEEAKLRKSTAVSEKVDYMNNSFLPNVKNAIDFGQTVMTYYNEKNFEEAKERLISQLGDIEEEYFKQIGNEIEFMRKFFPMVEKVREEWNNSNNDLVTLKERVEKLEQLVSKGKGIKNEIIDAEFAES